ncbi:hypothetical protein BHE74_00019380 [Ensete ventricosum]|nr:hypothetical protein BHE74_00019380 [Ensete ventricosum]
MVPRFSSVGSPRPLMSSASFTKLAYGLVWFRGFRVLGLHQTLPCITLHDCPCSGRISLCQFRFRYAKLASDVVLRLWRVTDYCADPLSALSFPHPTKAFPRVP